MPDTAVGDPVAARRTGGGWAARYRRRLIATDIVVIAMVVLTSQTIRFTDPTHLGVRWAGGFGYWAISALLTVAWILTLGAYGAWDAKSSGSGPTEFRRVATATFAVISCTAIFSFLTHSNIARGYLAIAFPLGLVGLLAGRWVWRLLLAEHRRAGHYLNSVLVVGGGLSAPALANRLRITPEAGYRVTGLCMPHPVGDGAAGGSTADGFPVLGTPDDVLSVVASSGVDTVAIAASDLMTHDIIRRLAWDLEGSSVQLVLAPALTDVAGPRIHIEPVAGLPLMDVRSPTFKGPKLAVKTALDYLIAIVALVLLSPVFAVTALAILLTSGRPLFYRPLRVGRGGRQFRLFRFRSMTVAADRITLVGRVIRRLGIDQSAQLLNVLAGHMSIVGARPADPSELTGREVHLERRTRLRPGMTGPSQVLGRGGVDQHDQLQMDLQYLENWTVTGDLVIIVRALRALFRRRWTEPASALSH